MNPSPDVWCFLVLCLRPAPALAAENFFLRKQLTQYQERQVKPRRASDAIRVALVWLSRFFDWRTALVIVQPATLIRCHCNGFRLMWRWKSRPGRPVLPKELASADLPYGSGELDVGPGVHRQWTFA